MSRRKARKPDTNMPVLQRTVKILSAKELPANTHDEDVIRMQTVACFCDMVIENYFLKIG